MICNRCGKDQSENLFQKACCVKGKQYYFKQCTPCKSAAQNKRKQELKSWLLEYKKQLKCERCGNIDYRVFDFHHIDPKEKEHTLSDMIKNGFSKPNIMKEINKCICLCSNCHRILHYIENNGE